MKQRFLLYRNMLSPYLTHFVLGGTLIVAWLLLLIRGLDLGLWGDVLAYEYHYSAFGVTRGMEWLVNTHWHRHLLGAIWSAPLHVLFPGQASAWWGSSLGLHFLAAFAAFILFNRILRGRWQIVSFLAALVFATDALQIWPHFEFGTNGHRNGAMLLAIGSMLAYFEYVKGRRKRFVWLGIAIILFFVSLLSYEQNQFFFLTYPLLAAFADRDHGASLNVRWVFQVMEDIFLFPLLVILYVFLLSILYPGGGLSLSIDRLIRQVGAGIQLLINPALWLDRIAPAVHAEMIFVSVVIIAVVYALVLIVSQSPGAISSRECLAADRQLLWRGVGFGLALALFTILGVAPTNWNLAANPRLVYAAGAGTAFAGIAGLAWIGSRLPRYVALVIFIIPAILIGLGAGLGVQQHTQRLACQANRQRVMDAIHEVLPGFSEHAQPYILLVSDAHPQRDLCLNPQDINFPYMFALLYGFTPTENDAIYADALLFDVHATERPSPGTPGITYTGQYIVVDAEGIYSPLRPGVAIDPASLIIVSYDSNTDSAAIMEYLSNDVIEQANIEVRAPIVWKTNFNLIAN